MANIRDITGKNRGFTGTDGIKMPEGTTAQRPASPRNGELRFNTTTNLAEYYTGTEWKSIDAPPTITQFTIDGGADVTSGLIDSSAGGNATIEVKGSLFDTTGANVTFVGSGETISTQSITRNSSSLLTVTVARSDFDNTNEPYTIKVTNGSGLSAQLDDAISQDQAPVFATAADTNIGNVYDGLSDFSGLTTVAATDADSDTVTHTISAGSLPSGMSLATNGTFSGTVGSDTVQDYTFTVQAATTAQNVTRQFVLSYKPAAADAEYTSSGTYTYTVPSGVTNISVVCIGAGGGAGLGNSGQGGGGGALAYRNSISVTPGTTATVVVGGGGGTNGSSGNAGGNSSFTYGTTTTTAGGGGGATNDGNPASSDGSGGSGGTRSGTYDGGGNGGAGGTDPANYGGPGGGGAGGYSGNGGAGASKPSGGSFNGSAGSGGGGGGGGAGGQSEVGGGGGGGVGFYGQGTSGAGGIGYGNAVATPGTGGGGGSGGTAGSTGSTSGPGGSGGSYGGGHGGCQITVQAGSGGGGAVRVIYHPAGASFPSTNVGNV